MTTDHVTIPTSYLLEKVRTLGELVASFDGGVDEVPAWRLEVIADTARAVAAECESWRPGSGRTGPATT